MFRTFFIFDYCRYSVFVFFVCLFRRRKKEKTLLVHDIKILYTGTRARDTDDDNKMFFNQKSHLNLGKSFEIDSFGFGGARAENFDEKYDRRNNNIENTNTQRTRDTNNDRHTQHKHQKYTQSALALAFHSEEAEILN